MKSTVKACKLKPVLWRPVNFGAYSAVYEASDTGQIRRIGKHTPLRSHPTPKGYLQVELFNKPQRRHWKWHDVKPKRKRGQFSAYVHRLIALTFVTNLENKRYVNHIDGHKGNNRADNLEWVTMDENNAHSKSHGLQPRKDGSHSTGARSPVCKAMRKPRKS